VVVVVPVAAVVQEVIVLLPALLAVAQAQNLNLDLRLVLLTPLQ
jgi:hypothetical protein